MTWAQIASLHVAPVGAVIMAIGLYFPVDRENRRSSR